MTATNGIHPLAIEDPDATPTPAPACRWWSSGPARSAWPPPPHLLERGLEPLVLEGGPQVGANIAQ